MLVVVVVVVSFACVGPMTDKRTSEEGNSPRRMKELGEQGGCKYIDTWSTLLAA